jgi:hypothetical protein
VRRAESKLLRPFADFQFRPWTQPVPSTQRFGKNHSSEFVQFELHNCCIEPHYFGNGNMSLEQLLTSYPLSVVKTAGQSSLPR